MRRLYIQSNFVLELVLAQEQSEDCERLLVAAEAGGLDMALPALCLAEPLGTLGRRHKDRSQLQQGLQKELQQLRRTARYRVTLRDADLEQRSLPAAPRRTSHGWSSSTAGSPRRVRSCP